MMRFMIAVLLYIGVVNPVIADIRGPGTQQFDFVRSVEDVPEGECRYVYDVPRVVDHLTYPQPPLLCRTQGIVRVPYDDGRTDEPVK